jgi:hypothetical protein
MNTFIDLYNYLITINETEFDLFLKTEQWQGKDKFVIKSFELTKKK